MADPTDRLASFADDGDSVPLAPAEAVRARGEQRRRSARTTVALTGAAMVLAAGTAVGLSLGGSSGSDSLGPASQAPTVSPSEDVTEATPTPTQTPAPSPPPASGDEFLLTAADASAARAGAWAVERTEGSAPLLDPCGGTRYPLDAKRVDLFARTLTHPDGQELRQQVSQYDTAASAAAAMTGYERAVKGCTLRNLDQPAVTPRFVRFHQIDSEPGRARFGDDALFVASGTGCDIDQDCDRQAVRYAVVRRDSRVSVLELAATSSTALTTAQANALADQLAHTAHLAVERIACEGGDCPRTPWQPSPLPRTAQLTHGGSVWAVFLAVSERDGTPQLTEADARARAAGYQRTLSGPYSCDVGAKEGLGYSEEDELFVSLLYFDTATTAARFVEAYDGSVVTTVKVQTLCLD